MAEWFIPGNENDSSLIPDLGMLDSNPDQDMDVHGAPWGFFWNSIQAVVLGLNNQIYEQRSTVERQAEPNYPMVNKLLNILLTQKNLCAYYVCYFMQCLESANI